jgi:hypothetical protein
MACGLGMLRPQTRRTPAHTAMQGAAELIASGQLDLAAALLADGPLLATEGVSAMQTMLPGPSQSPKPSGPRAALGSRLA